MIGFVMLEIRTINGMPNIPSCSTIATLKASDIIPVTKFCIAVKLTNNIEFNLVGIKSLSGPCDLKIQDKAGYLIIISNDEGSYADLYEFPVNSQVKVIMLTVQTKIQKKLNQKISASMKPLKK
jgi:hypothetical protein